MFSNREMEVIFFIVTPIGRYGLIILVSLDVSLLDNYTMDLDKFRRIGNILFDWEIELVLEIFCCMGDHIRIGNILLYQRLN